ncbi:glycine cleavage complex subunit P [Schizosaccharomyces japonicus yFS275]|uniref:Glycine cleavage system P protein n=1 Tax=Schizosaccharomyces japonicus (strain yFS275 / FY16936) TaxID=402676 RepID=B6K592_SCHJY|nr:glycine cleavage complex subunit P [Schizosaccharomyces japonicus yFS275]EEB08696.1 glycine cleavage complex subunit P [Schizosaccharomyces japonicus yFS275]
MAVITCGYPQRRLLRSVNALLSNANAAVLASSCLSQRFSCTLPKPSVKDPLFHALDTFESRHVGPTSKEQEYQLQTMGYDKLEEFLNDVIPESVRATKPVKFKGPVGYSEKELEALANEIGRRNRLVKSFIGMGYYNTKLPSVIERNVLENPAWYTQYTPYQAEISQGRLEAMINYQTMIIDLTGLPITNASLLDEGTAAGEAMAMLMNADKKKRKVFLVDSRIFPQTVAVLRTRATGFNIDIRVVDLSVDLINQHSKDAFGIMVQYPAADGAVEDYADLAAAAHAGGMKVSAATDLLALTLLKAPGEWGADVAVGSTQRFGLPMGFGGPHAGFFSCTEEFKRKMPGRLVGLSKDRLGNPAYRLALQTREQHIRREKATSNVCTAQALLANLSVFYAMYHGPEGLKKIANRIVAATTVLRKGLEQAGYRIVNKAHFDTLTVSVPYAADVIASALANGYNLRKIDERHVGISLDECSTYRDLDVLFEVFNVQRSVFEVAKSSGISDFSNASIPQSVRRTSEFLTHPIFSKYHSETEMMRYLHHLQSKDLSLAHAMTPLGSCTMKLNGVTEMKTISNPNFSSLHPYVPTKQTEGYRMLIHDIERDLAAITGFDATSVQPISGASGEYAGLSVIRAYQKSIGEGHRNICLIPVSAHGTNPASAAMAGLKVVPVKCLPNGYLDIEDLKAKASKHADHLAAFMVTYPSTFGVYEPHVKEALEIVHQHGAQVYFDGANMNAMVGYCKPAEIGGDICHFNLHKTFCIPHGGGGPGVGPIACKKHLAPFLPGNPIVKTGGEQAISAVSSAPFGSASILPISWAYIKMMGESGLRGATTAALLNANYMATRLSKHYSILYTNEKNRCAHEFIVDFRSFKKTADVDATDVAKRLQDYSFHAPTLSFPIANTLMVEPTESESLQELDRFCDALISIREEIREIEDGKQPRDNNLLKNAPHPLKDIVSEKWDRPYSRERAVYPVANLKERKFWPAVARLDDPYGDTHLFCTCPPVENAN